MKSTALLFILFLATGTFAQRSGDIVVFNNKGYQFHVVLNGISQNAKAESNVRIQGLESSYYRCMVIADDNTFSVDKNIIVKTDTLITYQIVGKKGKFKLRFYSETPMAKAPQVSEQSVVTYHSTDIPTTTTTVTTPTAVTTTNTVNTTSTPTTVNTTNTVSTTSSTSTVQTGTTVNSGTGTENVSISMTAGENGINVNMTGTGLEGSENVNVQMTGTDGSGTTTYQQTTTTTYTETINGTTTSSGTSTTINEGGAVPNEFTEMENTMEFGEATTTTSNCYISEAEANKAIQLIEDETFADDQLLMAKALVSKKCLNIDQIGRIADIITFEDDRLDFAKAAYGKCVNHDSYYQLMAKFTFSENKEALKKYIDAN